eukprot:scaffold41985_cov49-Attheya_sp.AAC.4
MTYFVTGMEDQCGTRSKYAHDVRTVMELVVSRTVVSTLGVIVSLESIAIEDRAKQRSMT